MFYFCFGDACKREVFLVWMLLTPCLDIIAQIRLVLIHFKSVLVQAWCFLKIRLLNQLSLRGKVFHVACCDQFESHYLRELAKKMLPKSFTLTFGTLFNVI